MIKFIVENYFLYFYKMSILMKIDTPELESKPEPEPLKNNEDEIFKFDDDEAVVNNEPFKEPVKPRPKKPRSAKQIAHLEKMRIKKAQISLERNADKVEMKRIKDSQKEEKRLLKEQNKLEREEHLQQKTIELLEKRNQTKKEKSVNEPKKSVNEPKKSVNEPRDNFEDFMNNYSKMKQMEKFFLEKNKINKEPVKQEPVKSTKKEIIKPQLKAQDFGFGMSYKKNNRRRYF